MMFLFSKPKLKVLFKKPRRTDSKEKLLDNSTTRFNSFAIFYVKSTITKRPFFKYRFFMYIRRIFTKFSIIQRVLLKHHFLLYLQASLFLSWLYFLKGTWKYSVNYTPLFYPENCGPRRRYRFPNRDLGPSIKQLEKSILSVEERYRIYFLEQKISKKTNCWISLYKQLVYVCETAHSQVLIKNFTHNLTLQVNYALKDLEKRLDRFGCIKTVKKITFTYRFSQSKN